MLIWVMYGTDVVYTSQLNTRRLSFSVVKDISILYSFVIQKTKMK